MKNKKFFLIALVCLFAILILCVLGVNSGTYGYLNSNGLTQLDFTDYSCSNSSYKVGSFVRTYLDGSSMVEDIRYDNHCIESTNSTSTCYVTAKGSGSPLAENCSQYDYTHHCVKTGREVVYQRYKKCTRGASVDYCDVQSSTGCGSLESQGYTCDWAESDIYTCTQNYDQGPATKTTKTCVYGYYMSSNETDTATISKVQAGASDGSNCPCPGSDWTESDANHCTQKITSSTSGYSYKKSGMDYCSSSFTSDGSLCVIENSIEKCWQCNDKSNWLIWSDSMPSTTNSCGSGWSANNKTEDSCQSYTISYDLKGGTGNISYQYKAHDVDIKITSVEPTKSGHNFKGWCVHTGANTVDFVPGATYSSNANITLYAVYEASSDSGVTPDTSTKSVRYIKDSGTASCYESASTSSNVKMTFNKCTAVNIADTNSNDWKYSTTYECYIPSSYITSTKPSSCSSSSGGSDTSTEEYTIIYDLNGATGQAPANQTKSKGTDLTLSGVKPTWSGYTFLGWNTDKNATVALYEAGAVYSADANATLYAIWKQDDSAVNAYIITYDANGGSNAPASQPKTHGVNTTLSTQIPTRTGYTFLGWNTDKNATVASYNVGAVYSIDANVTLYAIWKQDDGSVNKYTITYNANGGSNAPASQSKTHGVNVALSAQIPTRDGYTFLGWNTDKNAKTALYKSGAVYSADENVTLYAIWEENSKEDEDIKDNSPTGDIMISLVWLIGLGTLGYSIYYFRTRKMDI